MKDVKKINKKLNKIANSNRFVLLCSFLLAVSVWFWVSTEKSPTESIVISNVPIVIDYSESEAEKLGLQVFGESSYLADVTITGKRFAINKLTVNDLLVTASAKAVNSPGTKILPITATFKNNDTNAKITSVSKDNIDVYFDTVEIREYTLMPDIVLSKNALLEGYSIGDPILSSKTISINGPTSKLDKISNVNAIANINNTLDSSITTGVELSIESEDKDVLNYLTFEKTDEDITMYIPLFKEVKLPTSITFNNLPEGLSEVDIDNKIIPNSITVLIQVEELNNIKSINVGNVDYSTLRKGRNTMMFYAKDLKYKVLDNVKTFKVIIEL